MSFYLIVAVFWLLKLLLDKNPLFINALHMIKLMGTDKITLIDKSVDFIFSKDERKWLVLIFLLGLFLRFVVASNNYPVADEMIHGVHAIGVSEIKPLSTMTQGPVWFYLTDISYRLFNVHLWSGRIMSIFFGSLSIIAIYLLAGLFFSKKAALVSAFLFAFSPYQLLWARIYMDESLLFFVLLSAYLFIKDYKTKKYITPISAIFLGIGALIKIISGLFIVIFSVFLIISIYNNRNDLTLYKRGIRNAIYFFLIIIMCLVPLVSYNYFLYKSKGIVDLPFAMYFGINLQVYQGPGLAHGEGFMLDRIPHNIKSVVIEYFLKQDLVVFLLFLFGSFLFIKELKKNKTDRFEKFFLILLLLFPFMFMVATIVLDTHYTYFTAFFAILSAPGFHFLKNKLWSERGKKIVYLILILIFLINMYSIRNVVLTKSATEKLRNFAIDEIGKDDLVVVDSRIYRGNTVWMFNDKHYVDAGLLSILLENSRQLGQEQPTKAYFVECAIDDCGWGTIKDQPELNQSMENLVLTFENLSKRTVPIKGGGTWRPIGYDDPSMDQYVVYQADILINPLIVASVDQTHTWFFYDIPRTRNPGGAFDRYDVRGIIDNLLNLIAYVLLYSTIVLAVFSALYVFYLLHNDKYNYGAI